MVHSGVFYISEQRRGPKRRGAGGSSPLTPLSRRACLCVLRRLAYRGQYLVLSKTWQSSFTWLWRRRFNIVCRRAYPTRKSTITPMKLITETSFVSTSKRELTSSACLV